MTPMLRHRARGSMSLLVSAVLLGAATSTGRAQDSLPRHRIDLLVPLPADSARLVVIREFRAAQLDPSIPDEYLVLFREPCDPGFIHSTARSIRVLLQPAGADSTRVTFAATRVYWAGNQRCEEQPDQRRWITSEDDGKERRLWERMARVTRALVNRGAIQLPTPEPAPGPDSTVEIHASPVLVRLPLPPDVVRQRVVDVMLTRFLPPFLANRYQLESHTCREGARETLHVLLLPEGDSATRVLAAGERVDDNGTFSFLGIHDGPCENEASERTFVVQGAPRPALLRDIRAVVTALVAAGGTVETAVPTAPLTAAAEQRLKQEPQFDRATLQVLAPLAQVRSAVAAGFGDQRLIPLETTETVVWWDWCGRDDAAIRDRHRDRTVVVARLVPGDSGVTTVIMQVYGAVYDDVEDSDQRIREETLECFTAESPARKERNALTNRAEPRTWARARAVLEQVARLDTAATTRFERTRP